MVHIWCSGDNRFVAYAKNPPGAMTPSGGGATAAPSSVAKVVERLGLPMSDAVQQAEHETAFAARTGRSLDDDEVIAALAEVVQAWRFASADDIDWPAALASDTDDPPRLGRGRRPNALGVAVVALRTGPLGLSFRETFHALGAIGLDPASPRDADVLKRYQEMAARLTGSRTDSRKRT